MSKELFDSMNKQMTPSPQVRAALSEKLAQAPKKRPVPWRRYGAIAACAALVIGAFSLHSDAQEDAQWMVFLRSFNRDVIETRLHSYVTVEGLTEIMPENASTTETGGGDTSTPNTDDLLSPSRSLCYNSVGDTGTPNTGDSPNRDYAPSSALPGGAYVGDAPVQEEAVNAYEKLMDRFNGTYPDWYGGAYIDGSGWLVVQLVEDKDPVDKSLELQVLDWTDDGHVIFSSCKYSLAHLKGLMDQLNALPDKDMKCGDVMAGWGIDEEANHIELTLTQVYEPILAILAELDPDDDAICVKVGQRASVDGLVKEGEEPVTYDIMPGGVPVPDDEDLIAVEPYYDASPYDLKELPEQKQPAFEVDSYSGEDANTTAYNPGA